VIWPVVDYLLLLVYRVLTSRGIAFYLKYQTKSNEKDISPVVMPAAVYNGKGK
jgi:hypothetical protein